MTIRELLDALDGNGLIVTDDEIVMEALNRAFGLALDDEVARVPRAYANANVATEVSG